MSRRSGEALETLDRWSRFVVPDFGGDFNKARAANALNIVLLGLTAIVLISALGVMRTGEARLLSFGLWAALATLVVAGHVLMRLGRVHFASHMVVVGLWAIFTTRIAVSGGYRSPAGLSYALLCTIAGLLLGWRAAFAALVGCGAALVAFVSAETLGHPLPNILMTSHAVV